MTTLVGTSLHDDEGTLRLQPSDASHLIQDHEAEQLDRYCDALRLVRYPTARIEWEPARLDNGVVVIHIFDPSAGVLYRSFQPTPDGGSWEALDAINGDTQLGEAPTLMALAQLAVGTLLGQRPWRSPMRLFSQLMH